jgi:hypothetical protein
MTKAATLLQMPKKDRPVIKTPKEKCKRSISEKKTMANKLKKLRSSTGIPQRY